MTSLPPQILPFTTSPASPNPPFYDLPCLPKSKDDSCTDDAAAASATLATTVEAAFAEDKPPPVQKIEAAPTTDKADDDDDDDDDEGSKEVMVIIFSMSSLEKKNCEDSKMWCREMYDGWICWGRISDKLENLSQAHLEIRITKTATPASVPSNKQPWRPSLYIL